MKKNLLFKIILASMMASLAIILEKFSIYFGTTGFKITLYGLPLLVTGILFGPFVGFLSGFLCGLISQLTSEWGFSPTSILWMLAPIIWSTLSGFLSVIFKGDYTWKKIIYIVVITSFFVTAVNSVVIYLDALILEYRVEQTIVTIFIRLVISLFLCVPYTIICKILANRLYKLSFLNNNKLE